VAFWVHLDGMGIDPVPVPEQEWDEYLALLTDLYGPTVPTPSLLVTTAVRQILEQRVALMTHADELPVMIDKCREIQRKLERGNDFVRLVRLYSEDQTTKILDGRAGFQDHSMQRYPLERELFRIPDGAAGGPFWTRFGAEFYLVEQHKGQPGTLGEQVEVRLLPLYFDVASEATRHQKAEVRQHLKLRVGKERFRQILPPALQMDPPTQFGPTDITPLPPPPKKADGK